MIPSLTFQPFGTLPSGEQVDVYTLTGGGGLSLQALTYGGIITHLHAPDGEGRMGDVVLGFDRLEPYLGRHPYFGAIVGRIAGRVTGAQFVLEGRAYPLARNQPPNHLHGGETGLDRRLWTASPAARADGSPSLRLTYRSPDGEEGYPGTVDLTVTYTVTNANALVIETEAVADRVTPLCLAHHSYFNLAGENHGSIAGHELQIHSDATVAVDDTLTLLGQRLPVAKRPADLNHPRRLDDVVPRLHQRHGDLYLVRRAPDDRTLVPAARLTEPVTRRTLDVSTTENCLQFYSGSALDGTCIGKSGWPYRAHAGLCLECQGYPDGVNHPAFGNILLPPGRPVRHTTVYTFSTY